MHKEYGEKKKSWEMKQGIHFHIKFFFFSLRPVVHHFLRAESKGRDSCKNHFLFFQISYIYIIHIYYLLLYLFFRSIS